MPEKLLVIGAGDVAQRLLAQARGLYQSYAMVRDRTRIALLASLGATAFVADLDQPASLDAIPDSAGLVLHAAPPPPVGVLDPRTGNLLAALETRPMLPRRIVYISTSGVYGNCNGALIDEMRPVAPDSDRGRRRCDAEHRLEQWCERHGVVLVILRAPGIYAADRMPVERIRKGLPVLVPEDDVFTNHIHAEDLAGICARALEPDAPGGVYNASDNTIMRMADWMDAVADHAGLAHPPRIGRSEAVERITPAMLSFMNESRRLNNDKVRRVLGYRFRYLTVQDGLRAAGTVRNG